MTKKICLFTALVLLFSIVKAQNPLFRSQQLIKGKSGVMCNSIYQDGQGILWFATNKGLVQFNGIEEEVYTTEDSLWEDRVSTTFQDNQGVLWIGHASGNLSRKIGNRIEKFTFKEGNPTKRITSIIQDTDNRLWIATYGEGVYYYDNEKLYNFMVDEGLSDDNVYQLILDSKGLVWAATDGGISIINIKQKDKKKRIQTLSMKDGLPDNIVKSLEFESPEKLWIAMQDSGFCSYSLTQKQFKKYVNWDFGSVTGITLLNQEIWIGTQKNGLIRFLLANNTFRHYTQSQGIVEGKVFCLFKDFEDNLWIGTNQNVIQYRGNRFEFLYKKDGLLSSNVYSLLEDSKGYLWGGTDSGATRFSMQPDG
ncbi:MAG: hypothetical protein NZ108_02465, partial [Bacteroidia bacterium]|nr:hypothetical protein [Bacteroidia bacterium]